MKLEPLPEDGLALGADQVNVYGLVPPVADALHVTGLPAVALPQVALTMRFCPWTVTLAVPVFVAPLVSVAVTVIVLVPLTA